MKAVQSMSEFEHVASVDELPPEGRLSILVDDVPALLIRIGEEFFAVEDVCSHDGQPLTNGPIANCSITCPRHGARFDLRTGQPQCMPATEPIATFEVQIRDGDIFVRPRS
jgi:3-phenylpropionate/trans-cinnamate dioxygenase ferredoxin subunit